MKWIANKKKRVNNLESILIITICVFENDKYRKWNKPFGNIIKLKYNTFIVSRKSKLMDLHLNRWFLAPFTWNFQSFTISCSCNKKSQYLQIANLNIPLDNAQNQREPNKSNTWQSVRNVELTENEWSSPSIKCN